MFPCPLGETPVLTVEKRFLRTSKKIGRGVRDLETIPCQLKSKLLMHGHAMSH